MKAWMQASINAAGQGVEVISLCLIKSTAAIDALKASAEAKRKSYSCPIWCSRVLTDEDRAKINALEVKKWLKESYLSRAMLC